MTPGLRVVHQQRSLARALNGLRRRGRLALRDKSSGVLNRVKHRSRPAAGSPDRLSVTSGGGDRAARQVSPPELLVNSAADSGEVKHRIWPVGLDASSTRCGPRPESDAAIVIRLIKFDCATMCGGAWITRHPRCTPLLPICVALGDGGGLAVEKPIWLSPDGCCVVGSIRGCHDAACDGV